MNPKRMKEKVQLYAKYAGLKYNPTTKGERIKSNGKEYFILADDNFNEDMATKAINNDADLANYNSPFS